MRTKVTLVLVFLNVALFFFIFKFERTWRTEAASLEARRRVLGPEAADLRAIEVAAPGGAGFRLVRERDHWMIVKPLDRWPANPHAAAAIVNELQSLEHDASFLVEDLAKNKQTVADFGFAAPKLVLTLQAGDPAAGAAARTVVELKIGDSTPDGKRLYVLSPDGKRIHVVGRSLADRLATPLDQLRSDTVFGIRVFEARSLGLQTNPGPGAEAVRTNATAARVRIRKEGTRWIFDAPITARASTAAVELALTELHGLRAKSFPAPGAGPLPSVAPALRLAVEGNNVQEILYLGEPVAPVPAPAAGAPAAAAPREVEFYAQLDGRSSLFTVAVPRPLLDSLRNAQETLREKRILDFDPAALTAITVSAPLQSSQPPLDLKRIVDPAAAGGEAGRDWQIVRRGDNTPGPRTLPADPAAILRLVSRLGGLAAEGFKSDAPTSADLEAWGFNRPVREVELTLAGTAAPLVLWLGTDAARNLYARTGPRAEPGTSVYRVDPAILAELRYDATAWRDRAVLAPLPAAARLAALRLTDLESKNPLLDLTFNAAGEPAPAPREPKAVAAVVAALRALRAREYVEGGYTERVYTAGDDRPWRYLLEAVVAVPAAGGTEQTSPLAVRLTERVGGAQQFGGIKEVDTVFALEQPLVDALWALTYGPRDPGPAPAPPKK